MKGGFSTPTTSARDDGVEQQVVRKVGYGSGWPEPDPFGYYGVKVCCCDMKSTWHKLVSFTSVRGSCLVHQ